MHYVIQNAGFRRAGFTGILVLCCALVLFCACTQLKQSVKESWNRPHMVFSQSHEGSTDIYRVILDKEEFTPILVTKNGQNPHWNPETNMIVFVREGDLYMCHATEQNVSRLTDTPDMREESPSFSPDGTQVVYSAHAGGKQEIWLMNVNTRESRKLTNSSGESHDDPFWSPEGDEVVFCAWFTDQEWRKRANMQPDYNMDLMIVDIATGQMRHLTSTPEMEWRPRWSPDGRRVLYSAYERGETKWGITTQVFMINADGTEDGPVLANQHTFLGPDKMLPVAADYACWADNGDAIIIAKHFAGVGGEATEFSKVHFGTTFDIEKIGVAWYSGQPTWIGLGRDDSRSLEQQ